MCGFPEFKGNEAGKEGIKHMFELFEYSPQLSKIADVCSQYHLTKCTNDPNLKKLMNIIDSVATVKKRANITGEIATNHMKNVWKILRFSNSSITTSIAKKCLKIFPAVANCAEFYQFIKKKGYIYMNNAAEDKDMDNAAAFSSEVELITTQLQHEHYNETVLNHLKPAFQYISPFLDTEQSFTELMNKIVKLCSENIGTGTDPRKHFCQLETVNSNITMIKQWFSRAQVRIKHNYYH